MRKAFQVLALAAGLAAAAPAVAQPYGAGRAGPAPTATLYEFPGFRGRQFTVTGHSENLPGAFNDMAQSLRLQGRWRVCEHSDYGGRCVDVSGDVPDLNPLGLAQRVTSLQAYSDMQNGWNDDRDDWRRDDDRNRGGWDRGGWSAGGGWNGAGQNVRPAEGARTVFFPYPSLRGYDIAAGSNAANAFCRGQGLGPAVYFDSSARAREALDGEGRYTGETSVLRDVLCRR